MYHWIEDETFLSNVKSRCSDIVNRLAQAINNEGAMRVKQHLVGSGSHHLIVQNGDEPIDLDYNLEIVDTSITGFKEIKDYVQKKFDEILKKVGWGNCNDSRSVLTTDTRRFVKGNQTGFSIDLCIVVVDKESKGYRLIHEKTGCVQNDRYFSNKSRDTKEISDHVEWIKRNGYWNEVRDTYLKKKNMYLQRNDYDHPSFIVYIETVNEVYSKRHPGLRSEI